MQGSALAAAQQQSGRRRSLDRLLGRFTSRLAVGALIALLGLQGLFSLWAANRVEADSKRVQQTMQINAAFQTAQVAIAREGRAEQLYFVAPSPHALSDVTAAAASFEAALADVVNTAGNGHADDVALAQQMVQLHAAHRTRADHAFDARRAGQDIAASAALLDTDLDLIAGKLADVAAQERADVARVVAVQRQTENLLVRVTPIGFAVGLGLIGLCAALISAHRLASERERQKGDAALRRSAARFRALVDNSVDLILVLNPDRGIRYVSPACERVLGYDAETFKALSREALYHPDDLVTFVAARNHCQSTPGVVVGPIQVRMRHRNGHWRWLQLSLFNRLADPDLAGFVVNCHDITAVKTAEEELAYNATHDVLTGLPNRALLVDRLQQALARRAGDDTVLAVLFCDLDGFKILNDSRGHGAGDAVLKAVAQRLVAAVREQDTVARFGGDEFVVCCERLSGQAEALSVAARIRDCLAPAFPTDDGEVFLSASIGLRVAVARGDSPEAVIRDADAAMYQAKANGRNQVFVYSEIIREQNEARLTLESDLRRALERNELRVHYQPVVCVDSGTLVGMEALVRWEHPTRGLVPPIEFIGVAEDTGLIEPIGEWVLEAACRQLRQWEDAGVAPVRMAVNLSGRQLQAPTVVATVADILARTEVAPGDVCLEVTESVLMADPDAAVDTLARLRALGVHLAIDDFGTGYSSLAHLRRFPVDSLKIDRSFVANLGDEPEATAIVTAVVHLARALELTTVAEGVETASQRTQLQLLGCELAQGYHWSRPVDAEQLIPWLTWAKPPSSAVPLDALVAGRPYSVLVVDDDSAQRNLIRRILDRSQQFLVVAEAADGHAAVEAAGRYRPNLVLLDLSMPDVSGLEALPLILHSSPETKVVLLSGAGVATVPEGASAFVQKGVRAPDLLEELLVVMGVGTPLAA